MTEDFKHKMDTKRLILVMVLSLALVVGWHYINLLIAQRHPEWYRPAQTSQTDPSSQTAQTQPAATPAASASTQAGPAATGPSTASVVTADPAVARSVTIGHIAYDPRAQNPYPVGLTINPRGAALESAVLNRYRLQVEENRPYTFQQPYPNAPPALASALGTQAVLVNGVPVDLAKAPWRLASSTETSATYAIDVAISGADAPLTITKHFELRPAGDQTSGHELLLRYSLLNRSGQPVRAKLLFNGPNVPAVENSRDIPEIVVGHNDQGALELTHAAASTYTPDKGAVSLRHRDQPFLWAGATSAYFNAIAHPVVQQGQGLDIADIRAQFASPRGPNGQEHVTVTFETTEVTLAPQQETTLPIGVYLGPRQRSILNSPYYARFPLSYDRTLVLTSGICAFCTFQWLINILVWMLGIFHVGLRDWGLAIIALVILVRLLLHPITKRSQISMSKMGKMGPEIERLKKKYGDNKEELNKAMMVFYREQGITPVLGCLPMFLQMPIWIALWSALQSTFELRHAPFLWGMTWIDDLAQPDRLIALGGGVNLWLFTLDAINLLPVLLGVVFYLQQKMTPKPAAMTPEQEQQQKMMQWMSLLFPLLLYTGPSGLNLYILTSTAIGIWESKRVRDHLKEEEEREKAGRIIIDAPATRASRRKARDEQQPEPQQRSGCLGGWMSNLQTKARRLQEEAEKRYGKGK